MKDSIGAWFNQLKLMEFQDWLVILVENSDSRKANKLLPRTTVLDKVKSDFGGKTPERSVNFRHVPHIENHLSRKVLVVDFF